VSTSTTWILIGACAAITAVIKAAGPVALGGRELPAWFSSIVAMMAPALFAALVVTQALADGDRWAVDESTAGVAAAGLVAWRGASVVVSIVVAAAVTAGLRAL
jgi:branched-subunit amino acid transport protein